MIERTISATTHGRYITNDKDATSPILMGFHGYAEAAEMEFKRLQSIEGSDEWFIVAVQGLHRFYNRRMDTVVASWMTRQDRELAISDNAAYAAAVLNAITRNAPTSPKLVLSGFSQGVAMAYRCAVLNDRSVRGVIALAGDIPPELDAATLRKIPAVLLGRGDNDEFYTFEKLEADKNRLNAAGVAVEVVTFSGGHEWNDTFRNAASEFLKSCR
jgi:predicted esterase